MRYMSEIAYNYAVRNDIYYKIVEGEVDVSQTLNYFRVSDFSMPCEAAKKKYAEVYEKNGSLEKFVRHLAVYYAFLDIFLGILSIAAPGVSQRSGLAICY